MDKTKLHMYQKDMEGITVDINEIKESVIALTDKTATATALITELVKLAESKGEIWEKVKASGYSGESTQEFLLENFSDETTKD